MKPRIPEKFRKFPFWSSNSSRNKICEMNNYEDYAKRIQRTLYYGKLPSTDRPSLPVTDILVRKFGKFCKPDGFEQLKIHEASAICYDACVTPCSVIVALLYLERLRTQNPEYLASTSPSQVFVVALMVASKYLYDDGEEDEVYNHEWATSAAMMVSDLNEAEKNFMSAIEWNLFVDIKSFMDGLLVVESAVAKQQGVSRGFFVYSDLIAILNTLPSAWTAFIHLVGSAIVVCIVSYSATIFVVVASKQLTQHVANQIFQNRLEVLPSVQSNDSCYSPVYHNEEILNRISTEENELYNLEEKEDRSESNTLSRKFSALQALTTALLLASSKFLETPINEFHGKGLSHSFDYVPKSSTFWLTDPEQEINETLPITYDGLDSVNINQNFISTSFVPNKKPSRKWKKLKQHTNVEVVQDKRIGITHYSEMSRQSNIEESGPSDSHDFISDHDSSYGQLDYLRLVIEERKDIHHPRLSFESATSSHLITSCINITSFASPNYHIRFTQPSDQNYFDNLISTKKIIFQIVPKFLPFSILNSFLSPYQLLLRVPDQVEIIDWKSENFGLIT